MTYQALQKFALRLVLVVCGCCSMSALSEPQCKSPPLSILVGVQKPPYIEVATQQGYELELLRQVGLGMRRCVSFLHVPNGRLLDQFSEGKADLVSLQRETPAGLYATLPYIRYENVVIVREKDVKTVTQLADLSGRRVMAFQNAQRFLSAEYRQLIPTFVSYLEVVEQHQLPSLLRKNRVDALVMDRNIFAYYARQTAAGESLVQLPLLGVNQYHLLGRDEKLVRRFDQALQEFRQSPAFVQLQLKYFPAANQ